MAQLVVRNIDDTVKASLKLLASRHGCSMEEEVRNILSAAARENPAPPKKLGTWIVHLFKAEGLRKPIKEHRGQAVAPTRFG
jgi:plasmid stability protein